MTETEKRWVERILAWRASGQSAEQFAEGQGFKASTLKLCEYRLRMKGIVEPKRRTESVPAVPMAQFVRLSAHPAPAQERPAAALPVATQVVEIAGARLVVERGFDPALFRQVVAALRGLG